MFAKMAVTAVVFLAVYFFSFWMIFAQVVPAGMIWLSQVMALALAVAVAVLVWRKLGAADLGLAKTSLVWAVVAGSVGFAGGFFGPIIFTPEANQGPLLGLFITGPLGFVAGGIAGLIYGLWRRSKGAAPKTRGEAGLTLAAEPPLAGEDNAGEGGAEGGG